MPVPESKKTDEEITASVQRGDIESFGALVERYDERLARYGREFFSDREDIKDLVQEAFLKAYTNIQSFDATKRFAPWMYRIAHNEFVNAAKKKNRLPAFSFDLDVFFPYLIARETADEELKEEEVRLALDQSLGKLSAKYREPLVLYFFEDMDYKAISEILRVPLSTVGVRLMRGKALLKRILRAAG